LLKRSLTFWFDWIAGAQFAGLYWARDFGLYEAAGLDVTLEPWQDDGLSLFEKVARGEATGEFSAGCAEDNLIVNHVANGGSMMAFGSMLQDTPLVIMSKQDQAIRSIGELQGKRIGMHADGIRALQIVLALEGISVADLDLQEVGFDLEHLRSGRFDGLQGYVMTEPVQLGTVGLDVYVLPIKHHRLHPYSQVYFAEQTLLQGYGALYADFLAASSAGWRAACSDSVAASELLTKNTGGQSTQAEQRLMLDRVSELVNHQAAQRITGSEAEQWQRNLQSYVDFGLTDRKIEFHEVVFELPKSPIPHS
jgi:NitT/TauT family transport system substrate-binding protein